MPREACPDGPIEEICINCSLFIPAQTFSGTLFDHLVGHAEDSRRDREAGRLASLEVDDQRIIRQVLDRKVGRTGALQNAVDLGSD